MSLDKTQYNLSSLQLSYIKSSLTDKGFCVLKQIQLNTRSFCKIIFKIGKPLKYDKQLNFILPNSNGLIVKISNSEDGLFNNQSIDWHMDGSVVDGSFFLTALWAKDIIGSTYTEWCYTDFGLQSLNQDEFLHLLNNDFLYSCNEKIESNNVPHTSSKHKALFHNPLTNKYHLSISPLTLIQDESTLKTRQIIEKIIKNSPIKRHNWETNDLVIFDNTRTLHRRPKVENLKRELWRIQFDYSRF